MPLSFLEENEYREVRPLLQEIDLEKGQYLFHPADSADGIYFLLSGRLGVQAKTGFEDKSQVVALLDAGSVVGEKGIQEGLFRGMTVVAIEEASLYLLKTQDFKSLELSQPAVAIKILKRLLLISCIRLQENSNRLAHVL